jgi:hypothetical protein
MIAKTQTEIASFLFLMGFMNIAFASGTTTADETSMDGKNCSIVGTWNYQIPLPTPTPPPQTYLYGTTTFDVGGTGSAADMFSIGSNGHLETAKAVNWQHLGGNTYAVNVFELVTFPWTTNPVQTTPVGTIIPTTSNLGSFPTVPALRAAYSWKLTISDDCQTFTTAPYNVNAYLLTDLKLANPIATLGSNQVATGFRIVAPTP